MPHIPNFPSDDADDDGRDRSPGSIIDRIIGDDEFPVPNAG
ncbi:hypothetical protein [Natrinema caseinilyticum]|nr:hypothetical protein [Natrinema caseinilyticum]